MHYIAHKPITTLCNYLLILRKKKHTRGQTAGSSIHCVHARSNAATAMSLSLVKPAETCTQLNEHKQATRNGGINNNVA